jgi:FkbM family methyltransferase
VAIALSERGRHGAPPVILRARSLHHIYFPPHFGMEPSTRLRSQSMLDQRFAKGLRLLRHPSLLRAFTRHRVAASLEHTALPVKQYATVVDIGAHTGQFSLLARCLYPGATIHAFEPLPEAAAKFREVFAADPRVRLHEAAVAPTSGDATLYVGGVWDAGSLLPSALGSAREIHVHAAPLEEFVTDAEIRPLALLKLDVQGFEREALMGCRSLLHRFDDIVAELMLHEAYVGQALAADVICMLRNAGFQLVGLDSLGREGGKIVRFDGIFSRLPETTSAA